MIKIERDLEIFKEHYDLKGKCIADIGCGAGNLVRSLTAEGASVIGVDSAEMIARAEEFPKTGDEIYKTGSGEALPLDSESVDLAVFMASFHHIAPDRMAQALSECYRVLKTGGEVIFIEPVAREGSYYDLIKLQVDEKEIQEQAFHMILEAEELFNFRSEFTEFYYLERSIDDFRQLMDFYVEEEQLKGDILAKAEGIINAIGGGISQIQFKSITRINILKKIL